MTDLEDGNSVTVAADFGAVDLNVALQGGSVGCIHIDAGSAPVRVNLASSVEC
jgi:hypothetical protein